MLGEEGGVGQSGIVGEVQTLTGVCAEALGHGALRECITQVWRHDEPQIVVEGDQTSVKSGVVQAGEAEPVAHVQDGNDDYSFLLGLGGRDHGD